MKNRIISELDASKYTYESIDYPIMYIADWSKETNKARGVEITDASPNIEHVYIDNNEKEIQCDFFGFKDNALVISPGNYNRQCECILFPEDRSGKYWVLCVETKYAKTGKEFKTFDDGATYPTDMVKQIISTVSFLRDKNVIPAEQEVSAIVSFPKLLDDFSSQFAAIVESKNQDLSTLNVKIKHNIRIKATNKAIIKSEKRIKL
ncbi:MAG: hypothetical protein SNJ29_08965 [Rikenellaceae bacterium]